MIQHIIAISTSYVLGIRIAWHYADNKISPSVLQKLSKKTKSILGSPEYSIHKLNTDSKSWSSVIEKDSFFKDLTVFESLDDFLNAINSDKQVTALDIAKLLLSIQPMPHLKLQKMIYLAYADYLSLTRKRLFEDEIIAFKYGPVVKEVYDYYKANGSQTIEEQIDDRKYIHLNDITIPMTLAKILQSDDKKDILNSVKETFIRYGSKTAYELVDITHREGSPWDRSEKLGRNTRITDDLILKYHSVELVM